VSVPILVPVPLHPAAQQRIKQSFTAVELAQASDPDALLREAGPNVRGIAQGGHVHIDDAYMARLPRLEIIANFGVGYDSIDVAAARRRKVIVTNTPDVLTEDVADLAIGLLIGVHRRMAAADDYVRRGDWLRRGSYPLATSCTGRVAGILGLGRIGQAIARRLEPMRMQVRYHSRRPVAGISYPYHGDALTLAEAADVLIVACPGGPETRNLVDARVLEALGPEGVLINISRGSVVDEGALVAALEGKRIRGAGLDVFVDEPNVPAALLSRDDVFLLPHVGSATVETRAAMANLMVDNLVAHFAGKPVLTPVP
jgi:lactate dehydrogenase-like 2-hydroxyacid dehydrogenase